MPNRENGRNQAGKLPIFSTVKSPYNCWENLTISTYNYCIYLQLMLAEESLHHVHVSTRMLSVYECVYMCVYMCVYEYAHTCV